MKKIILLAVFMIAAGSLLHAQQNRGVCRSNAGTNNSLQSKHCNIGKMLSPGNYRHYPTVFCRRQNN